MYHLNFLRIGILAISLFYTMGCSQGKLTGVILTPDGKPLAGSSIRIVNSGYKAISAKNGAYAIPYHSGEFVVAVEKAGYFPKGTTLKLSGSSQYPMEDISLIPFPPILDMFGAPLSDVAVTITDEADKSIQQKTDSSGHFMLQYMIGTITVMVEKQGYKKRNLSIDFDRAVSVNARGWVLPPDPPGLFVSTIRIDKAGVSFAKKPMQGLMIPAYYDGRYTVSTKGIEIPISDTTVFYWIPENSSTLGDNPFASKGGAYLFKAAINGFFVSYDGGSIALGDRVNVIATPLLSDNDVAFGGLVQEKIQVFTFKVSLPKGCYVFYQGGGNSMDTDSHPDDKLGCYPFTVVGR